MTRLLENKQKIKKIPLLHNNHLCESNPVRVKKVGLLQWESLGQYQTVNMKVFPQYFCVKFFGMPRKKSISPVTKSSSVFSQNGLECAVKLLNHRIQYGKPLYSIFLSQIVGKHLS